ncbi:TPA: MazG family protein, partial [Candidatus Acetothermia bacterium]|nr:MazG family protein [Candidatus Acetothermia bacterium]
MGHRSFNDLVELVAQLRAEEGCPWDRAQDHRSLRPYLLEEAHEAIAAIDAGDPQVLADELGDLLLQILLHSQIACEKGTFCIDTVIDLLVKKLIRRHPHVFGDAPKEMEAMRRTWEAVKQKEGRVNYPLPT